MKWQQTLSKAVTCQGIGAHSGNVVNLKLLPAAVGTGITFKRTDLEANNLIKAIYYNVVDTKLCTVIANNHGAKVSTIEHLMAAFWSMGVDNALVEIDGVEVPIMDGSSKPFIDLIEYSGTVTQSAPKKYITLRRAISITYGDSTIELLPASDFSIECTIDFTHPMIGKQKLVFGARNDFQSEIAEARTFGFLQDLETLKKLGLAQGSSLENAVGLDETQVLNTDGLRFKDEFVRHKVLDCLGDLYLAGCQIKAKVIATKPGHAINNLVLKKIFEEARNYSVQPELGIKLNRSIPVEAQTF
jgi:UDP-3-O-[3-hydroxymyristoyl] N-acetylglucosamine deacetylase